MLRYAEFEAEDDRAGTCVSGGDRPMRRPRIAADRSPPSSTAHQCKAMDSDLQWTLSNWRAVEVVMKGTPMTQRMNMRDLIPGFQEAMIGLEKQIHESSIEASLIHLMKLRASQLNHCAFCVNMHTEEALADGVDPRKLYLITVWEESWLFSDRERAALAWTESVTLVAETGIPDEDFEAVRAVFSEKEVAELTAVICAINVWNRLSVSSRAPHK